MKHHYRNIFVLTSFMLFVAFAAAQDGIVDSTFDTDGRVITAIGSGYDIVKAIAIQSDGKIVVAGSSSNGNNFDFAITRYNSDGSLDNTFDFDGKVITDFDGFHDFGRSVAIQADGKIVVAGS